MTVDLHAASVRLGGSPLVVPRVAVGTWAWGDRELWGYEPGRDAGGIVEAFGAAAEAGLTFFDTAETYGHGESEKILGFLARKWAARGDVLIATKFAPLPGRSAATLGRALEASLRRLGRPSIDLYQVHWADTQVASIESLMDAMAALVHAGKVRAVGVSNFRASELRTAHAALARHGIPLASQQVEYSLVCRAPEHDGVAEACAELGVTLLAYSPLGHGLLAGGAPMPASRARRLPPGRAARAAAIVPLLAELGAAHGTGPGPIALAWLLRRGALPIAGARTAAHAVAHAAALDVVLGEAELDALERASADARG